MLKVLVVVVHTKWMTKYLRARVVKAPHGSSAYVRPTQPTRTFQHASISRPKPQLAAMRTLLSRQLVRPRALFPRTRNANVRRPYSANTQPPSPPEASEAAAAAARKQSRLDRVISRRKPLPTLAAFRSPLFFFF